MKRKFDELVKITLKSSELWFYVGMVIGMLMMLMALWFKKNIL